MSDLNQTRSLHVSPSVRLIETRDGAVLLDIRQGICLSMTPVAVKIWHLLELQYALGSITNQLSTAFRDVPQEQITDDVVGFVADLERKGLLLKGGLAPRPTLAERLLAAFRGGPRRHKENTGRKARIPHFLMLRALFGLLALDLFRFGHNFMRTHAFVQSWRVAPVAAPAETVELVCKAVNYACVWYPKRVLCLQRSAATTCLLRSCGIPAQMVMGAQKLPFQAHAWTEVDGNAINERREVQKLYLVWERC